MLLRFFRRIGLAPASSQLTDAMNAAQIQQIPELEHCFYVEAVSAPTGAELDRLAWVLRETFEPENFSDQTFLQGQPTVAEVGPRLNFETSYSSTAVDILNNRAMLGGKIRRVERSRRYGIAVHLPSDVVDMFLRPLHDRMTEMRYPEPPQSFAVEGKPAPVETIDMLSANWRECIRAFSEKRGLGWDDQDLEFYRWLYQDVLRRNATDAELFGLGQGNSNHCRHWDFNGIWFIDGMKMPKTLMQLIKSPLKANPGNSVLAFCDDSSALRGRPARILMPADPLGPSPYRTVRRLRHPTCTAETHCHPTMWEPYQGEATKEGIFRDEECVGRGGEYGIGGDGEMVGNLHIPGYEMPWEDTGWKPLPQIASPLQIALRGTSGAFDYGNAYGHPITHGFFRTGGITLGPDHFEWFKPVAYGVVVGSVDDVHLRKAEPKKGMALVLMGGPGYRIGVGGGSGSSMMGGQNDAELDFNSVQRGDPQMGNRLHRVVRGATELLGRNPIVAIHDLGAGGVENTAKELVEKTGGVIYLRKIPVADPTLSTLEIKSNESQERNLAVVRQEDAPIIEAIGEREGCPVAVIGEVTGTGRYVVVDELDNSTPIDLPLRETLGELPPKTFHDKRCRLALTPLDLPADLTVAQALDRVLRLPAVASKQWLVGKVDRSVTGLVAGQQCVGPNHLPVADYAIKADSYFGLTGVATSLGERPFVGLISPEACARMVITEAILNLAGARIDRLSAIKGSVNWMLAVRLPGMGAWLNDAMTALVRFFVELTNAPDGGKDSMSLATKAISPAGETARVPAPASLVFAPYCSMKDIRQRVTPYIPDPDTALLHVDLGLGKNRLGGSALAQVYKQVGTVAPDMDDADLLRRAFETIQRFLDRRQINSAHDVSDGGLVTTLLEMGWASNLGIDAQLSAGAQILPALFSEEPGIVLGCRLDRAKAVMAQLRDEGVPAVRIGTTRSEHQFRVFRGTHEVLDESILDLRAVWNETSYQLDRLQTNPCCADSERRNTVYVTTPPPYKLTFAPSATSLKSVRNRWKLAIGREEGSNGDREMAAMAEMAGFEAVDVNMNDLHAGRITLDEFRGFVPVGGFAHKDVFDAGKGWAAGIKFNLREQFERFRLRPDTFTFGVCNGAQLGLLLGWAPDITRQAADGPRFIENRARRFQSRFSTVAILESPAIMLRGMAGSRLGVWVSHGEGRLHAKPGVLAEIERLQLAPIRYVDVCGEITDEYPFNPNGSPAGIAAVCSPDGRHLMMMPHPERTCILWQWPYLPEGWEKLKASPWLKLFQNAREWCDETK